ncbi:MAG: TrkH family potassium uptake protein [Phycisphaerae bacterium]
MTQAPTTPTVSAHPRRRGWGWSAVVNGLLALAAVSIGLEYGFDRPPLDVWLLHLGQFAAVGLALLQPALRLAVAPDRLALLRANVRVLALFVTVCGIVLLAFEFGHLPVLRTVTLSVVLVKALLVTQVAVGAVRLNLELAHSNVNPGRTMVLSFAGLIILGGLLLSLPKAMAPEHRHEEGFYEAKRVLNGFFTATSAACVTGLVVYDTSTDFSPFGQAVILGLIQVGGLGIMMFGTMFGMLVGRQLSLRQSLALQDSMSHQTLGEVRRMMGFILLVTLSIEAVGAVLLYPLSAGQADSTAGRVFFSVFHAISAFCNAGFALHGDSLVRHSKALSVYGVIMPLIVLGGLGFPVLHDLLRRLRRPIRGRGRAINLASLDVPDAAAGRHRGLSLHSKLVLVSSGLLILAPAALLFLFETGPEWRSRGQIQTAHLRAQAEGRVSVMADQPVGQRAAAALFQSVTARTAGFNTVHLDVDSISPASHFLLCLLMFIGGSPASTAGGVKTVAVAVLVLGVYSTLRRRQHVECAGRTIPLTVVRRASAVIVVMFAVVSLTTLGLCYTESASLQRLLFEAVSACGTVGLTTGLTQELTVPGRFIIIAAMFAGRLGPLTVLIALAGRDASARYEYPPESPIIG